MNFSPRNYAATEFVAVEEKVPHRILVEKKVGKEVPKFVKSSERLLKTPEEVSLIRKILFDDPGYLIEL